jgi:hypothetical protein
MPLSKKAFDIPRINPKTKAFRSVMPEKRPICQLVAHADHYKAFNPFINQGNTQNAAVPAPSIASP